MGLAKSVDRQFIDYCCRNVSRFSALNSCIFHSFAMYSPAFLSRETLGYRRLILGSKAHKEANL